MVPNIKYLGSLPYDGCPLMGRVDKVSITADKPDKYIKLELLNDIRIIFDSKEIKEYENLHG